MTEHNRNFIPLFDIHIPPEEDARIREPENLAKAVKERVASFLRFGQLQPILVQELQEPIDGKKWRLIDGQVRWVSMMALSVRHDQGEEEVKETFERWNMKPGHIEATTRKSQDDITSLMMEFHANEDRDDFTWEEKGRYIRRIHDMLVEHNGKKWTAKETAKAIGQSEATLSHYLQLTDEKDPATQSPRVRKATTKGAALKQLKIEKEKRRRIARAKRTKEADTDDLRDYEAAARLITYRGDCREWIKKIPDNSLDWFHWDPPYGGKEGTGGAFAGHEPIQTEHDYALSLMIEMLPEIWRALSDGSWIAIWYTPVHYSWLRYALQGHRFTSNGKCMFCDKHILTDHAWLSSNYSCRPSPFRFWVNPYPNFWRKTNRVADGHEIQRFFTKETEPFLLAGKSDEKTPILMRSNRGNVFDFESITAHSMERRHVHHKPKALLKEILSCISVPGGLGGDAGSGSGSILEASYELGRRVVVAELDKGYHETSLVVASELLRERNFGPESVAPWLSAKFTG